MAVVHIPSAMRELTGGATQLTVAGNNVREVIEAMEARCPGFEERLLKDGKLRPGMQVFVDGASDRAGLRATVRKETPVHFIPALAGGSSRRPAGMISVILEP
jgi:molybdopterin synthase sulfur carrier subunit